MSKIFKRGRTGEIIGDFKERWGEHKESVRRRFGRLEGEELPPDKRRKTGDPIPPLELLNTSGARIDRRENAPAGWNPNDDDIDE